MQERHHDYESLPILGHLIWYGLAGIRTDQATLLHLLQQHGFQDYAPEPPTDKLALQRALREWIRQRGATQRRASAGSSRPASNCAAQRWQGGYRVFGKHARL